MKCQAHAAEWERFQQIQMRERLYSQRPQGCKMKPSLFRTLLLLLKRLQHYPAQQVHGDRCSFPQSLINIINNRSPSLSLHPLQPPLPTPPALKPGLHGGLRLPPIDCGGERAGRDSERGGCFSHEAEDCKEACFYNNNITCGS